jgi:hypothetical protein
MENAESSRMDVYQYPEVPSYPAKRMPLQNSVDPCGTRRQLSVPTKLKFKPWTVTTEEAVWMELNVANSERRGALWLVELGPPSAVTLRSHHRPPSSACTGTAAALPHQHARSPSPHSFSLAPDTAPQHHVGRRRQQSLRLFCPPRFQPRRCAWSDFAGSM